MKKVYIEYGGVAYARLFTALGFLVVHAPEAADLICFTGGSDVSPALYGDKAHPTTHSDPWRDEKEKRLFQWAHEHAIPMVGICRGGQFLNVMSGGRMYQHVTEHGVSHDMIDLETGETIFVTSTHHQMFMPSEDATIVALAHLRGHREWYDGDVKRIDVAEHDNEVVFYRKTGCLCFQPHPEMYLDHHDYDGMRQYFRACIKKFFQI